jgi:hypothetical protein
MTYALRDSTAIDGGRWLGLFEAGPLPYFPWLATASDGWCWTNGGTSGADGQARLNRLPPVRPLEQSPLTVGSCLWTVNRRRYG